jgi:hypothetical protein
MEKAQTNIGNLKVIEDPFVLGNLIKVNAKDLPGNSG